MEIIPNSQANDQLQEEIADLERKFLLAKKVSLKKSIADLTSTNNTSSQLFMPSQTSNAPIQTFTAQSTPSAFGQFFEQLGGKEHFLPFMQEFRSIDIQHIRDIKRNKFKPGNIVKLSTSIRRTGEIAKNVKLGLSGSQNRDSGGGLHCRRRQEHCVAASFFSRIQANSSFPRPLGRSISTESCPRQVHRGPLC